jgi:(E)-4-hydroxy-3-methylbut-2-enyl-diphosphate synthase
VRFTVPALNDAEHLAAIRTAIRKEGLQTPLIADVHFNAEIAFKVAGVVEKVRINPGNFAAGGEAFKEKLLTLISICRSHGVALRIGVNHGSLSPRIMDRYGDTPEGMAESAMEYLRVCREEAFDQVVVSMKASNVLVMVAATRLVARRMDEEDMHFPLHLGVTEAGEGEDGRIKSASGIGTLLLEGLGDTIRVSLTEDPEQEVPVARKLLEIADRALHADPLPEWGVTGGYVKRPARSVGIIGGNHPPVVMGTDDLSGSDLHLVTLAFPEVTEAVIQDLSEDPQAVLVYLCTSDNVQAELRWLRARLEQQHCTVPVIFQLQVNETTADGFQIVSAASLGGAFIDGFGNGIWLTATPAIPEEVIRSTAFGILQACRARITRTDYISCPSCGRTNFDLITTTARIREATAHLKGLKIGIMGCIVNGPGEMADADYGYVGAGIGKITLYKGKEVVKRGIPEERAVDELIALIREGGDWKDPA